MAARPTNSERETTPVTEGGDGPDGAPATPVRRAPFADNPTVGTRGLRTQQRILDAALQVFGEQGYERSTIDRMAQLAGCSRVSIYQYFSGKDDVFRHLAAQVARQMQASAEALDPITPDLAGWTALRAWTGRYGDVYARYEPVFRAFGTAVESDAKLAGGSVRAGERNIALFQSKVAATGMPPRQLGPIVALLQVTTTRSLDVASILREAAPDPYPRDRVEDAVADVLHRVLFGLRPGVNARVPSAPEPPALRIGQVLLDVFRRAADLERESAQPGRRALASMLAVGHDVVVRCGYQGTRVDDVVAAAGVSHGAFYRYFENKDDFVRVVAVRALGSISTTLADVPATSDRAALRRWLRRYNEVHAAEGAMVRVWVEGGFDPIGTDRAAVFDWGRRRMARLMDGRRYGDPAVEAAVLLAVMEAFGAVPRQPVEVDAALDVLDRGFLADGPTVL